MTFLEAYRKTVQELASAGIDNPEWEAELITRHLTGVPLWKAHVERFDGVSVPEKTLYEVVSRRARREPLQLILGRWEFYGREFTLKKGVFIPRQETEVLVEEVISLLDGKGKRLRGLEVGVGSGVISVSLLAEVEGLEMVGVDLSPEAVALTVENARAHRVDERISLICADARAVDYGEIFDFIVSNPPYVPETDFENLMPEVKFYDPGEALIGGPDGLSFLRELVRMGSRYLKRGGFLAFEFGCGQLQAVERLVNEIKGVSLFYVRRDLAGTPRVAVVRRN